jgi:hypothetical protein
MDKTTEKRRLERKVFSNPILIECNEQNTGSLRPLQLRGMGIDIHSDGIGILADQTIDPGGVVKLYLPLGDPKTVIPTFSEVRWTRPSEGRYRIGLHFII